MTLDELRDWYAEQRGWRIFREGFPRPLYLAPGKPVDAECRLENPFPATLDGAARAMPDGWIWGRMPTNRNGVLEWVAENANLSKGVRTPDTGNEIYDRYLLAKLCIEAKGGA